MSVALLLAVLVTAQAAADAPVTLEARRPAIAAPQSQRPGSQPNSGDPDMAMARRLTVGGDGADRSAVAADTVVVCPEAFREALGPWIEYRRKQSHRVAVVSNLGSSHDIRRRIRETAKGGRLRFVVLVGDADPDLMWDATVRARCVPMHYAKARINVLWGSQPTISTDNWYAQPETGDDENPRPELAVGRLTADSPEELRQMIDKIIAYEQSTDFGPWRRQMNFVAGVGGFGPLTDMVLESAAQYFLTRNIPAEYHVSMTYGSWHSPYCPDPRRFRLTTLDRLNEGSLFWVYMGHGYPFGLDRVQVPRAQYPILAVPDVNLLDCRHGRPIALMMACYTGAIDARPDCLAEVMLRTPGGPVAVLAGSRVTMPYAMTVMATNLTDACFQKHCETLGEALLYVKQNMLAEPAAGDQQRAMLDTIAAAISPMPRQLAAERAEHVLMFNLIGDPLLRLRHPKEVRISAPSTVLPGTAMEISGTCPINGRGTLELVLVRDRLPLARPDRSEYPQVTEDLAEFQEVYVRANDRRLETVELEVRDGRFTARFDVPQRASGRCHVCMFVEGNDDFASGAADVQVTDQDTQRPVALQNGSIR